MMNSNKTGEFSHSKVISLMTFSVVFWSKIISVSFICHFCEEQKNINEKIRLQGYLNDDQYW